MKIYFTDYFNVSSDLLEDYGAFNISLINDLPLFIDPFLLFGSEKEEYRKLHEGIIKYLVLLKKLSNKGIIDSKKRKDLYEFPEVKQNWFGYSKVGNGGRGLGSKFGVNMYSSIGDIFDDLGNEEITQTSHLEKVALFDVGIGKDSISDFTTNLIKSFLLNYTESFAKEHIQPHLLKKIEIEKALFNYDSGNWISKSFELPFMNDYVILTPKDILTKDDTWINKTNLIQSFENIKNSLENQVLRDNLNRYFFEVLYVSPNKEASAKEKREAAHKTIKKYPEFINYYIKSKEDEKEDAIKISQEKVHFTESFFIRSIRELTTLLKKNTQFYDISAYGSYEESFKRLECLKDVIENNEGNNMFYVDGLPIKSEGNLKVAYRFIWYALVIDKDIESLVINKKNTKLNVEFKLASNTSLEIYFKNRVENAKIKNKEVIYVVFYFDINQYSRIINIFNKLGITNSSNLFLIDVG